MGERRLRFRCEGCGKPLTDPVSVRIGIGPTCRLNRKLIEYADLNIDLFHNAPHANFDYTIEDNVVCVVDTRSGRSVTNDADAVVDKIVRELGSDFPGVIIYQDARGIWDQLVVQASHFTGFRSLGTLDKNEAKVLVEKKMRAGAPILLH